MLLSASLSGFNINNLVLVLCVCLFLCQVIIIVIDFSRKETNISIGVDEIEKDGKILPCLTFCPLPGFKGKEYEGSDLHNYLDDTFGLDETFPQEMIKQFDLHSRDWLVKEVFTTIMGRCSMTCYKQKVEAIQFFNNATYYLSTSFNYQV
jgi:hypothetical protein